MLGMAEAATSVAGLDAAMNTMVSLIIALCGLGIVGVIAYRGIEIASGNYREMVPSFIGIGIGGGMIGFCRQLGASLVAGALGMTGLVEASGDLGDVLGILLAYAPVALVTWRVWRGRHGQ